MRWQWCNGDWYGWWYKNIASVTPRQPPLLPPLPHGVPPQWTALSSPAEGPPGAPPEDDWASGNHWRASEGVWTATAGAGRHVGEVTRQSEGWVEGSSGLVHCLLQEMYVSSADGDSSWQQEKSRERLSPKSSEVSLWSLRPANPVRSEDTVSYGMCLQQMNKTLLPNLIWQFQKLL